MDVDPNTTYDVTAQDDVQHFWELFVTEPGIRRSIVVTPMDGVFTVPVHPKTERLPGIRQNILTFLGLDLDQPWQKREGATGPIALRYVNRDINRALQSGLPLRYRLDTLSPFEFRLTGGVDGTVRDMVVDVMVPSPANVQSFFDSRKSSQELGPFLATCRLDNVLLRGIRSLQMQIPPRFPQPGRPVPGDAPLPPGRGDATCPTV